MSELTPEGIFGIIPEYLFNKKDSKILRLMDEMIENYPIPTVQEFAGDEKELTEKYLPRLFKFLDKFLDIVPEFGTVLKKYNDINMYGLMYFNWPENQIYKRITSNGWRVVAEREKIVSDCPRSLGVEYELVYDI